MFGVVTSLSSALVSFAVVVAAAAVSDSSANSVAGDVSDDDDTPFVDDSTVLLSAFVVPLDDSSLLMSPVRVSIAAVELDDEVSSGVTSLDVATEAATVVVDDDASLGSVLATIVLANGVVNVLPSI